MRARAWAALTAALALAACATTRPPAPSVALSMAQLPGWSDEDHAAALRLVRQDCLDAPRPLRICDDVTRLGAVGEGRARRFLEAHFRAEPVASSGLLTAYFTPTYDARRSPDGTFNAPVRPPPLGSAGALDRAEIDDTPSPDALAWMRPEDLFFMQIQGSGDLVFADGRRARAVFAASNGRPFVAIAGPMVAEGLLPARQASAASIHAWLAAHRGPEAKAAMALDPRYVFFRLVADDGAAPRGASGAALIAGRSVAVDPTRHAYFELLWIDADSPALAGARPSYRRLVAALDTGGAIKGEARVDLYLGQGAAAGAEAASVRHPLRLYRIVPRGVAR